MNYAAHSHCPNCFQPSTQAICANCGFDRATYVEEALHLPLFSVVGGQYTLGRVVAADAVGIVYTAQKTGGAILTVREYYPEPLAVRTRTGTVMPKSGTARPQGFAQGYQHFIDEARLLNSCQPLPGIVRFVDLVEQYGTAYWVMDSIDGCPLQDAWHQQPKQPASYLKLWLKPLLDTLEQLQQRGIHSPDLTLHNIFLRGGAKKPQDPVLMDLGLTRQSVLDLDTAQAGDGLYTLGALLFQCLNGTPPPSFAQCRQGVPLTFAGSHLDPYLKTAIERCLMVTATDRPADISALKTLLAPFLNARPPVTPVAVAEKKTDDLALWQHTRNADSIEAYQAYLQAYPASTKKEAAEEAMKRLKLEAELKLRQWQEAPRKDDGFIDDDVAEEEEEDDEDYDDEKPTNLFVQLLKVIFGGLLLAAIGAGGWAAYQGYLDMQQKHQGQEEEQKVRSAEQELTATYLPKDNANGFYQSRCPDGLELWQKLADANNATAQALLSGCYLYGQAVPEDKALAAQWLRKAADQGLARAQAELAELYKLGQGVTANPVLALQWYRKAADQGLAGAQFNVGQMYASGSGGVTVNDREALEWFRKAAEQGYAPAQTSVGLAYEQGKGTAPDRPKSLEWLQKAAGQGDLRGLTALGYSYKKAGDFAQAQAAFSPAAERNYPDAQFGLALLYQFGSGVKQDFAQAAQWFRKAADQGHAPSQYYLGNLYELGNGVGLDLTQAVDWYKKAATQGDPEGQARLGYMFANGKGIAQDDQQAVEWYKKAAAQGSILGQVSLGYMYDVGRGISQDYQQAFKWYKKAAEQGLASAQGNLGVQYQFGKGVEQDYQQAAYWYGKAATQGYAPAQTHLAYLYASGKGVAPDLQQAIAWYQKAAAQGDADAQKGLQALGVQ